MHVVWTARALADLGAVRSFVAESDPAAASRLVERILEASLLLADHPQIGRPGRIPGTRELIIPRTPYLVPYRVRLQVVDVLRVYHGARRWPRQL